MPQIMTISKKAYQISYTLLRFAQHFPHGNPFRESLFELAIALVIEVNTHQEKKAIETLTTLQWVFRLAADSGLVLLNDAESLIEECYELSIKLDGLPMAEIVHRPEAASLGDYLKEAEKLGGVKDVPIKSSATEAVSPKKEAVYQEKKEMAPGKERVTTSAPSPSTRERQASVIEIIRQQTAKSEIAVCRLKDLQAAFPDVSERTLRYDLQKLMDEGKVERLGGGPTSAYRLKKESFPPTVTS